VAHVTGARASQQWAATALHDSTRLCRGPRALVVDRKRARETRLLRSLEAAEITCFAYKPYIMFMHSLLGLDECADDPMAKRTCTDPEKTPCLPAGCGIRRQPGRKIISQLSAKKATMARPPLRPPRVPGVFPETTPRPSRPASTRRR